MAGSRHGRAPSFRGGRPGRACSIGNDRPAAPRLWEPVVVIRRLPLIARLALGVLLIGQGLSCWSNPSQLASFLRQHTAWESLPLVGGQSAIELAIVLALARFTAGVFLTGGFITRGMSLVGLLSAGLLLALGAEVVALNALAVALAAAVLVFGGGGRTLDGVLGRMQRRSIERDRQRAAEREAARHRAPG